MCDVGYLDESGRLWFCGRKANSVETHNKTYFTIPSERVFNTCPHVKRTALVEVEIQGAVKPVVCVEMEPIPRDGLRHRVAFPAYELSEIAKTFEHTQGIVTFLQHPGFPMDVRHNAKIYREQLAVWAKEQLS